VIKGGKVYDPAAIEKALGIAPRSAGQCSSSNNETFQRFRLVLVRAKCFGESKSAMKYTQDSNKSGSIGSGSGLRRIRLHELLGRERSVYRGGTVALHIEDRVEKGSGCETDQRAKRLVR
jgi:hypothetical protein